MHGHSRGASCLRRFLLTTAAALAGFSSPAAAQWLKTPVLLFQPGGVRANAISPTEVDVDPGPGIRRDSPYPSRGTNVRFTMVVPTASPTFNLVLGTQFQPNGLSRNHNNQPGFYYGAIIPVNWVGELSRSWLSFSIDPLGVYGPSSYSAHPYSHELYLEGALVLNVGSKMMANMGPWSGLGAYFLLDQQLTHVPHNVDGDKDYFTPVMLYGLTIPIAPWGK
jgi:hypothetical protein